LDDPALLATALTIVAARADRAGRPEPALFERAIALAERHGALPHWTSPRTRLAECLLRDGNLDDARELLQIELETSSQKGDEFQRRHILENLVDVELSAGNW